MDRAGTEDREARMAEEVSEVRGMDDGGGLSLWGSLRSKLAPLLGMLACARRLITARRKGRGDERALCCRRCQRSVPLGVALLLGRRAYARPFLVTAGRVGKESREGTKMFLWGRSAPRMAC